MQRRKIIIFRTDLIGDFIITTSLIQKVKNKFPDSDITIVCSKKNYRIAKLYNFFDKIIVFDKKLNFFKIISLNFNFI